MERLEAYIRNIPDFPKPGIQFKDITPLVKNPAMLRLAVHQLIFPYLGERLTAVVGMESFLATGSSDKASGIDYVSGALYVLYYSSTTNTTTLQRSLNPTAGASWKWSSPAASGRLMMPARGTSSEMRSKR